MAMKKLGMAHQCMEEYGTIDGAAKGLVMQCEDCGQYWVCTSTDPATGSSSWNMIDKRQAEKLIDPPKKKS